MCKEYSNILGFRRFQEQVLATSNGLKMKLRTILRKKTSSATQLVSDKSFITQYPTQNSYTTMIFVFLSSSDSVEPRSKEAS